MKKLLILYFISIFLIFISVDIYAANWEFKWSNTVVKIPVGDSLTHYTDIPYARLYKDGNLLADADISYIREGDWLRYLSNVDTNKVGSYNVWYKAYENQKYRPGTCTGYKALVTFNVVDEVVPTINVLSNKIKLDSTVEDYSDKLEDILKSNVIYSDNYSNVSVRFEHNIDTKVCGIYDVLATAVDDCGNYSRCMFELEIYDSSKTSIYFLYSNDYIRINKDTDIDMKSYFTAIDSKDGDISENIMCNYFDTSICGIYDYTVSVVNSLGNETTKTIVVEVVDNKEANLVLNSHVLVIDYLTNFDEYNFMQYVDYDDIISNNLDYLNISHDLENKVGNYHIYYDYDDTINSLHDSILVKCISKEAPKIIVSDIEFFVNSNINLINYIEVEDSSDSYVLESLKIDDSNVNYSKAGTYYAKASVMNSSGLTNNKTFRVIIKNKGLSTLNIILIVLTISLSIILVAGVTIFIILFIKKKQQSKGV